MLKKIGFFFLSILCCFGHSFANQIDPMNLPKFQHFVNDYSQVLTQEQAQELNQLAKSIEMNSGHQVVTVLFPHREGNELFDIALKAFNDNGIGDKEKNDGLLLAIATEEKKIRIIVGYGLEGEIPDALASRIIEEKIRPEVNNGNFYQAVKNFYEIFSGKQIVLETSNQNSGFDRTNIWVLLILILLLSTKGGRELLFLLIINSKNGGFGNPSGGYRVGRSQGSSGRFGGGGGSSGGGGAGD